MQPDKYKYLITNNKHVNINREASFIILFLQIFFYVASGGTWYSHTWHCPRYRWSDYCGRFLVNNSEKLFHDT